MREGERGEGGGRDRIKLYHSLHIQKTTKTKI